MESAVAQQAARLYGADSSDLTPLRGGHVGSAYRFLRRGSPCILRIAPSGEDLDASSARAIAHWMHLISSCYVPPSGVPRRPDWDSIGYCFNPSSLPACDRTGIGDRRAEVMSLVKDLPRGPDSYSLIHADLHTANLCVDTTSGLVTLFDFDDCCYGWYAMDIAMSLFDAVVLYGTTDAGAFAQGFLRDYLRGYVG